MDGSGAAHRSLLERHLSHARGVGQASTFIYNSPRAARRTLADDGADWPWFVLWLLLGSESSSPLADRYLCCPNMVCVNGDRCGVQLGNNGFSPDQGGRGRCTRGMVGGFRRLGGWPPVAAGQEPQHHQLVVCWHATNAATFRVLLWKSVIYKQQCRSKTIKTIHSSRLPSVFKTQRSPCSTISAAPADSLSYQSCTSSARSILQIPNLGLTRSCFHALAECPGP